MNMDKPVIITIQGLQAFADQEEESVDLVTEGRLACHDADHVTLSYRESALTGMEGTLTTFQVEPQRITLLREGEVNSQMVFEEGRRHLSLYDTPYGSMTVGVSTRKARSSLSDSGGEIVLHYAIEIDHAVAGENSFRIHVREPVSRVAQ